MIIEQIYTKCLAQGAYYVESNGEAFLIDPLRETKPYLDLLEKQQSKLKYIFETHFHADFVSGHLDLAKKTGATIVFGPTAQTDYDIHQAKDNEVFQIGAIQIKVLHTPGHTMESSTFLLVDEAGKEKAIFTGDTLFIGDVGRPDLAIKSDVTEEDLAGLLYDSLRHKIMPLADDIIVYPAHGAGSACGKNMSKETYDTLGNQKKTNYALRADMTKTEFTKEVLAGLTTAPGYFALNAKMNKIGYTDIDTIYQNNLQALPLKEFKTAIQTENVLLLDTRSPGDFSQNFIASAINIGLDGDFAPWVGSLIQDWERPIVLITDIGREKENRSKRNIACREHRKKI
jgi:glyoxylase-like metal-dependent hydrolase (beta-lactamase superfamily II)